MRLLGKTLLVLLSFVLIASLTLWIFTKNIEPETIKAHINEQISAITHKKSTITGSVSWQLLPRPSLKLKQVLIGDSKNNDNYIASIDSVVLNLKMTPLLRGIFIFNDVAVDGLKIQLNQNSVKAGNLSNKIITNKKTTFSKNRKFAIERFSLTHSQITLDNETTLKNIQLGMEQFNLQNRAFPIQIKAKLNKTTPNMLVKANVLFTGRLTITPAIINDLSNIIKTSSLEGQLLMQNVLVNQIDIKKISATIKTAKDIISFNPLTLSLYDGESIGDMSYMMLNNLLNINQTATNLNGKELITALLGHEVLSGTMDYSIHANVHLAKKPFNILSSNGNVVLKEGELYEFSMDQMLNGLKEQVSKLMSGETKGANLFADWNPKQYQNGKTEFKLASMQYQFKNEQISSDSLLIQTDKMQIKGNGSINLVNHEMNSKLQISLNPDADATLQKIQGILGGYFPIAVSGTMEKPLVTADFRAINPLLNQIITGASLTKPLTLISTQLKGFTH